MNGEKFNKINDSSSTTTSSSLASDKPDRNPFRSIFSCAFSRHPPWLTKINEPPPSLEEERGNCQWFHAMPIFQPTWAFYRSHAIYECTAALCGSPAPFAGKIIDCDRVRLVAQEEHRIYG